MTEKSPLDNCAECKKPFVLFEKRHEWKRDGEVMAVCETCHKREIQAWSHQEDFKSRGLPTTRKQLEDCERYSEIDSAFKSVRNLVEEAEAETKRTQQRITETGK